LKTMRIIVTTKFKHSNIEILNLKQRNRRTNRHENETTLATC
jgi:hypothetical protein